MVKNEVYDTELCDNKMKVDDCEIAILRNAVDINEREIKKTAVQNPTILDIIKILETFLRRKKLICYGGTAINNILPKTQQFYDKDIDIPDYDFYSPKALEDSKELADIYSKFGYTDVEAKAGIHFGTYKVFVNYIPIADVTQLDESILKSIRKESLIIDKIHYAPPNFLRMNMYLELSRPYGDVSRWEKVFKRLKLLNSNYPFKNRNCSKIELFSNLQSKKQIVLNNCIRDTVVKESAIFFGGFATYLYSKYLTGDDKQTLKNRHEFDILAIDAKKLTEKIVSNLNKICDSKITVNAHKAVGEIIAEHYEICVDGHSVAFIYKTLSCHSYNTLNITRYVTSNKNVKRKEMIKVNVATIDTMIAFYLAFYYTDRPYYYQERILCMTKLIFDVEEVNRLSQSGLLKRFSKTCYGTHKTMNDIRIEKTEKFKELNKNKKSQEYEKWFLKYTPNNKTSSKKKKRNVSRKTQKTIIHSMKQIGMI